MKLLHLSAKKLAAIAILAVVTVLMTGCGALGSDQNTFSPSGEVAQKQFDLIFIVLIPATLICIGVMGALLYIMIRYRRREGDGIPEQVHGNDRLEIGWTIAPTLLLLVVAVPVVMGIIELGGDADDDALGVTVVAFQWDWRFRYTDPEYADADGNPLETIDLYIPVDRDVDVELEALDVIHSFWVPKLAGKLDVMPGRTNGMWFNATEPGVYAGQCAEFCGLSHSFMRFSTTALPEEQFAGCLAAIEQDGEDPLPEECVL